MAFIDIGKCQMEKVDYKMCIKYDLNLENSNSIVKYLEENGYATMAAHPEIQ